MPLSSSIEISAWAKERVLISRKLGDEYKNLVKGLGAMIIQNGLLATLLFLKAKGKDHHNAVLEDLNAFFKIKGLSVNINDPVFEDKDYLKTTSMVLEMNKWLRRYADILIKAE